MTGHLIALLCILASGDIAASKAETVHIEIGKAHQSEMGLVLNSWKMSVLDTPQNDTLKSTGMVGKLFTKYNEQTRRIMATEPLILVAREKADPSFAYGWICAGVYGDELALIYVYTKYKFRRLGIARDLKDAVLSLAPDDVRPVYCARSVHDEVFEDWGFTYRDVDEVIGTSNERRVG